MDPNRNFGYHWGGYGASDDPCKETYRGSHAFSEPETLAMKNFLLSEKADFKVLLNDLQIMITLLYFSCTSHSTVTGNISYTPGVTTSWTPETGGTSSVSVTSLERL